MLELYFQVLSLLNVVFNFFLLNVFFEGEFLSFGKRWISSLDLDPANNDSTFSVLTDVFPKMTLCEWRQRGVGGDLEVSQFNCDLPVGYNLGWSEPTWVANPPIFKPHCTESSSAGPELLES